MLTRTKACLITKGLQGFHDIFQQQRTVCTLSRENERKQVVTIYPNLKVVDRVQATRSEAMLLKEVEMKRLDFGKALLRAGPITKQILDKVPLSLHLQAYRQGHYIAVDVRVNRLSMGQLPRPGIWHCDGNSAPRERGRTALQQLALNKHWQIACTVSSHAEGVSNTRYITYPVDIEVAPSLSIKQLWNTLHGHIEGLKEEDIFFDNDDGQLLCYDNHTLHRAMPAAVELGTRLWVRVGSTVHKPN